ncbi:MAG: deoxyribose-phosphate aldolase [Beutenbergiaceae bacterium]
MMDKAQEELTAQWLASHVDISCVQATHTHDDVAALAATAIKHGFISAHVLPNRLTELLAHLRGTAVLAGAPVGFPSGGSTPETKFGEARQLLDAGAQELDIVVNIGRLKSGESRYCIEELARITSWVAGRVPTRMILEVSVLDSEEIRRGCDVAVAADVDYIKTGTGWQGATTLDHVRLISQHLDGAIAIKAAGGIRTLGDVRAMRARGVSRFGINDTVATALLRELGDGDR